ncbi:MAG: signal recognition particle-docking protein FtsY [Candidatus Methanomethylophilaceae archaeon]|nr:signal recognition particle-docking protein FtsY [Candidatus Methanomethylophilaceae archaeon]
MFDSLKLKLKGIFKKAPAKIAETPEEKIEPQVQTTTPTPSTTAPAPEPSVQEQPKEEPKKELSRKEQKKLEKESKKSASKKQPDQMLTDSFFGKKIKENNLEELLWELEIALLEADVALPVVEEIKEGVKKNLVDKKYSHDHTLEEIVELSIKDAVRNVLKLNEFDFDAWFEEQSRPTAIMFVGINGTGKTTAIAKIANRLMKNGHTVVLAAGDTFRAGAIEQLSIHADKLGCKIVKHSQDADPAAVAFDAIEHAKAKMRDTVLIDTAGRMQTNNNLIDEMKKIVRVSKPALKIFVGDSLAGNDAVVQAKAFDDAIGVDAIILTKIDADSKGGAALSIAHTIGKPIAFVCNGQEYDDIVKFNADWMIDRLFSEE